MSRVVVIGAGVGGLSVAARLTAAGHRVTVFEQSDVVGGKLGRYERVTAACEAAGRAERPVYSAAQTVAVGRTDAEAKRRAEAIRQTPYLHGTPAQVADRIGEFAELGATRIFLQVLDISDLDHLDVIAGEVAPQL